MFDTKVGIIQPWLLSRLYVLFLLQRQSIALIQKEIDSNLKLKSAAWSQTTAGDIKEGATFFNIFMDKFRLYRLHIINLSVGQAADTLASGSLIVLFNRIFLIKKAQLFPPSQVMFIFISTQQIRISWAQQVCSLSLISQRSRNIDLKPPFQHGRPHPCTSDSLPPSLTPACPPPSPLPAVPGCSCLTFALACRWAEQVSRVGQ